MQYDQLLAPYRCTVVCLSGCWTLWPNDTSYSKSTKPACTDHGKVVIGQKIVQKFIVKRLRPLFVWGTIQIAFYWLIDWSIHTQLPMDWNLSQTSWHTQSERKWRCTSGRKPTELNPACSKSLYRIHNHTPHTYMNTVSSNDITSQFTHNEGSMRSENLPNQSHCSASNCLSSAYNKRQKIIIMSLNCKKFA